MKGKTVVTNKKAFRDYFFSDKWEAGIELKGAEVKSLRAGEVNFKDSFVRIEKGEAYVYNLHIHPYAQASYLNLEPDRRRKLLLHHKEIAKIADLIAIKRLALIPTKIYFNQRGLAKIELALGRGKKQYDKREDMKKRDFDREVHRATKLNGKRKG